MKRLQGKTALVTGANSGIGLASSVRLSEEGAAVILVGRNETSLQEAAEQLPGDSSWYRADVASDEDLVSLSRAVDGSGVKLDVLFINAGIATPQPFADQTLEHFDNHFAVNVRGALFTLHRLLPLVKDGGSVIFTTSCLDQMGAPGMTTYSATKAAVRSMVRTLAAELAPRHIRVNAVAPGPIETPIYQKMGLPSEVATDMQSHMIGQIPLARFGRAEEVAAAVAFLASDDASYITGIDLAVDGGMGQV